MRIWRRVWKRRISGKLRRQQGWNDFSSRGYYPQWNNSQSHVKVLLSFPWTFVRKSWKVNNIREGRMTSTLGSLNNADDDNKNGTKNNMFRLAKQQLCTCIKHFCTFLCRRCTTTTWNCLISCLVEDVNTRRLSFSLTELWYSPLEFNSRNIRQHLTNWRHCTR